MKFQVALVIVLLVILHFLWETPYPSWPYILAQVIGKIISGYGAGYIAAHAMFEPFLTAKHGGKE